MTNELDALPESVREALRWLIEDADSWRPATDHVRCIRAELLRLTRENGECRSNERIAIKRALERGKRAVKAASELAAIKKRIAESATGIAKRSLAPGRLVIDGFDDDPSDYHGLRVALLPLDDEAKS